MRNALAFLLILSLFCCAAAGGEQADEPNPPLVAVCFASGLPFAPSAETALLGRLACGRLAAAGFEVLPSSSLLGEIRKKAPSLKAWPDDDALLAFLHDSFPACAAVLRIGPARVEVSRGKRSDDPLLPLVKYSVRLAWSFSLLDARLSKVFDRRSGAEKAEGLLDPEGGKKAAADLREALTLSCARSAAAVAVRSVKALLAPPLLLVVESVKNGVIRARPLDRSPLPGPGVELLVCEPPAGNAPPEKGKPVGKAVVLEAKNGLVTLKIVEGEAKKGYLLREGRE